MSKKKKRKKAERQQRRLGVMSFDTIYAESTPIGTEQRLRELMGFDRYMIGVDPAMPRYPRYDCEKPHDHRERLLEGPATDQPHCYCGKPKVWSGVSCNAYGEKGPLYVCSSARCRFPELFVECRAEVWYDEASEEDLLCADAS